MNKELKEAIKSLTAEELTPAIKLLTEMRSTQLNERREQRRALLEQAAALKSPRGRKAKGAEPASAEEKPKKKKKKRRE